MKWERCDFLAVAGLVAVIAGFAIPSGNTAKVDVQQQAACRASFPAHEPELAKMCDDPRFVAARTSGSAQEAAATVSSINQNDIVSNVVQKFLWGFGLVALLMGVFARLRTKQNKKKSG